MCVCVYVCVYVCMCMCVCACVYVCMCMCVRAGLQWMHCTCLLCLLYFLVFVLMAVRAREAWDYGSSSEPEQGWDDVHGYEMITEKVNGSPKRA